MKPKGRKNKPKAAEKSEKPKPAAKEKTGKAVRPADSQGGQFYAWLSSIGENVPDINLSVLPSAGTTFDVVVPLVVIVALILFGFLYWNNSKAGKPQENVGTTSNAQQLQPTSVATSSDPTCNKILFGTLVAFLASVFVTGLRLLFAFDNIILPFGILLISGSLMYALECPMPNTNTMLVYSAMATIGICFVYISSGVSVSRSNNAIRSLIAGLVVIWGGSSAYIYFSGLPSVSLSWSTLLTILIPIVTTVYTLFAGRRAGFHAKTVFLLFVFYIAAFSFVFTTSFTSQGETIRKDNADTTKQNTVQSLLDEAKNNFSTSQTAFIAITAGCLVLFVLLMIRELWREGDYVPSFVKTIAGKIIPIKDVPDENPDTVKEMNGIVDEMKALGEKALNEMKQNKQAPQPSAEERLKSQEKADMAFEELRKRALSQALPRQRDLFFDKINKMHESLIEEMRKRKKEFDDLDEKDQEYQRKATELRGQIAQLEKDYYEEVDKASKGLNVGPKNIDVIKNKAKIARKKLDKILKRKQDNQVKLNAKKSVLSYLTPKAAFSFLMGATLVSSMSQQWETKVPDLRGLTPDEKIDALREHLKSTIDNLDEEAQAAFSREVQFSLDNATAEYKERNAEIAKKLEQAYSEFSTAERSLTYGSLFTAISNSLNQCVEAKTPEELEEKIKDAAELTYQERLKVQRLLEAYDPAKSALQAETYTEVAKLRSNLKGTMDVVFKSITPEVHGSMAAIYHDLMDSNSKLVRNLRTAIDPTKLDDDRIAAAAYLRKYLYLKKFRFTQLEELIEKLEKELPIVANANTFENILGEAKKIFAAVASSSFLTFMQGLIKTPIPRQLFEERTFAGRMTALPRYLRTLVTNMIQMNAFAMGIFTEKVREKVNQYFSTSETEPREQL